MTIPGERLDAVVAEAVAGDRDALREVLETIRPVVVRYCRARVGTTERSGLSADDVAQEVCLAAMIAAILAVPITSPLGALPASIASKVAAFIRT